VHLNGLLRRQEAGGVDAHDPPLVHAHLDGDDRGLRLGIHGLPEQHDYVFAREAHVRRGSVDAVQVVLHDLGQNQLEFVRTIVPELAA
jgi:hypothetical protein